MGRTAVDTEFQGFCERSTGSNFAKWATAKEDSEGKSAQVEVGVTRSFLNPPPASLTVIPLGLSIITLANLACLFDFWLFLLPPPPPTTVFPSPSSFPSVPSGDKAQSTDPVLFPY